jgi:hypothetical protein
MATPLQIITDQEGHKKSVIVPYKQWKELNRRYEQLNNKVKILTGIQDAMKEVGQTHKTGKKLPMLTDFLNKSRG